MTEKTHIKNKIFFDLDGTLIDASDRLYQLFCDLIPECIFSKQEYWNLKRNKINHQMILAKYFPKYNFEDFNTRWLSLIEEEKYLTLDKVYDGVFKLLENIGENKEIYLLTARQSKENLTKELKKLDLENYFEKIYVTENKFTKDEILNKLDLSKKDIFVTDMGKDIEIGNKANITTVAVTYGFMNEENLLKYKPDYICSNINGVGEVLND